MCTVTSLPLLSLPSGDYLTSSRLSENIELLIKMWLVKIYLASNSNPHYKDINAQCMALSEYKNYILWKLVSVVIQRGEHFRTFWVLSYAWNINTCLQVQTSLMVLTISSSAEVWKLYPSFLRSSLRYRVTSRPATSDLIMLCGMAKPS